MSLGDAFVESEQRYRSAVLHQTWGHQVPPERQPKPGFMVFTHGAYGQLVPIDAEFKDVGDSPWFYEGMMDFISRKTKGKERGKVFRFDGTCTLLKNGKFRFMGKTRIVPTAKRRT